MNSESHVIGIDLGTTNSVVAVVLGTEPEVITNIEGSNKTPSVVAFLDEGEVVVGEIARRQAATNPNRTISSVKRLMGRDLEELEDTGEDYLYSLVSHDGETLIDIDGMGYRPEQISAIILQKLKESAEEYLQDEISKAVITVPAYFDDLQRQATIDAAEMAGLEVLRLINEPTAAAMAYGLGRSAEAEEIIAVYDWGGGTFDITILEISGKTFEVLTSTGDSHLGGDDLDHAIVNRIIEEFYEKHGVDLTEDPVTVRRLKEVAERAKCELSSITHANISLPFIAYKDEQPLHLERPFSRTEFEEILKDYVRRTIRCCRSALEEANLSRKDINRVIMVGGTTRIPMVEEEVEDFFDQAVFKGVNPDEVVALGAAAQAGIFEGNVQEVILLDVTPHSLGIEVEGNKFSRIIDKNSTIPIKAAKTFTTTEDNQQFVNIHVLQGENDEATENRSLGKFSLMGIPPATAGHPRVRVTFFINADGVAEISAEDMSTGTSEQISIIHSQLTEEERGRRSRRRARANRSRRFSSGSKRTGIGRNRDTSGTGIRKREDLSEGKLLTPAPVSDNGKREEAAAAAAEQQFAVLGDASPSDHTHGVAIRPREAPERTLEPVDYSKSPPTYTKPVRPSTHSDVQPAAETIAESRASQSPQHSTTGAEEQETIYSSRGTGTSEVVLPRDVADAVELAEGKDESSDAVNAYQAGIKVLSEAPYGESRAFSILRARTLLSSMAGELEPSRDNLCLLRELHMERHGEEILALHNFVCDKFNDATILRERATARQLADDLVGATADLEKAIKQAPNDSDTQTLERLYRQRIEERTDPQAMFRLVKLLLKKNDVDSAIDVLQDLRTHEAYEARAIKVLGLCHWQKNMHHLAWQNLKTLPIDDDMKDILYRLASDMEAANQLPNAIQALTHLQSHAPDYRDVDAKLRKLNYRLKLQKEEEESHKGLPVLSRDSRFNIIEEINRGSMGIIYKAEDKTLNEIVALKVLNDYLCADPSAVERFKSEARAAKKLSHPYIVRIHDLFEMESRLFLSMEFIEGRDLKRLINEHTTFPNEQIIYFCLQICDALSYAHRLGIVHRDIKPANIMIKNNETIKITDFGIAKILRGDEATKSGTAVIGTPLYMAPEQIIGEEVDGRTDIYSLGIMMYEMVAGNPPFYLGNIEYHHIHTPPPQLPDRVDSRLRNVITRMIAKKPDERYQAVDEVAADLKQAD